MLVITFSTQQSLGVLMHSLQQPYMPQMYGLLSVGWEYTGILAQADDQCFGENWEFPQLIELPQGWLGGEDHMDFERTHQDASTQNKLYAFLTGVHEERICLCIHCSETAWHATLDWKGERMTRLWLLQLAASNCICTAGPKGPWNPCLYWVGRYDQQRCQFLIQEAAGPYA